MNLISLINLLKSIYPNLSQWGNSAGGLDRRHGAAMAIPQMGTEPSGAGDAASCAWSLLCLWAPCNQANIFFCCLNQFETNFPLLATQCILTNTQVWTQKGEFSSLSPTLWFRQWPPEAFGSLLYLLEPPQHDHTVIMSLSMTISWSFLIKCLGSHQLGGAYIACKPWVFTLVFEAGEGRTVQCSRCPRTIHAEPRQEWLVLTTLIRTVSSSAGCRTFPRHRWGESPTQSLTDSASTVRWLSSSGVDCLPAADLLFTP